MALKRIGIPAWKTGENSVGSTLAYVMFAEMFGEVVFLMPKHTVRTDLDLLILPGGLDLPSTAYGERPNWLTGKSDPQKDYFDKVYLPQYIANGTPILAICRGLQSVTAHFIGKLIQHMNHETNKPEDPYKAVHKIVLDAVNFPNSNRFSSAMMFGVNSRHHQAAKESSLERTDLVVIARHPQDHTVEMIAHKTLPIVGIQFHIEDIYEAETCNFINNIVLHLMTERTSILV